MKEREICNVNANGVKNLKLKYAFVMNYELSLIVIQFTARIRRTRKKIFLTRYFISPFMKIIAFITVIDMVYLSDERAIHGHVNYLEP